LTVFWEPDFAALARWHVGTLERLNVLTLARVKDGTLGVERGLAGTGVGSRKSGVGKDLIELHRPCAQGDQHRAWYSCEEERVRQRSSFT